MLTVVELRSSSFFWCNTSMHVYRFCGKDEMGRDALCGESFHGCFVWLWVPVSLQRPARWTTAAVTARVTTRSQECAAAVLLASRCSQTAKPAKVTHHLPDSSARCCCCLFPVRFELPTPPQVNRNGLSNLHPPLKHEVDFLENLYSVCA